MRIEETDVIIEDVSLIKFMQQFEELVKQGYTAKSYDLSVYCPSHNGKSYYVVMEKGEAPVAKEATNVAEQGAEVAERDGSETAKRRAPPVRKPKQA